MRLLCLGYGYCANAFVAGHRSLFGAVAATCRRPEQREVLVRAGITAIPVGAPGAAGFAEAVRDSGVLLVSAAPDAQGDPFVAQVGAALRSDARGKVILYLSTIGVYGDHGGAWVDEDAPPAPASGRSRLRLEAERAWLEAGAGSGATVHLLRLAGIYGPGSSQIDSLRAGRARRIVKPGQVFNRIHVEDIAAICAALLGYRGGRRIWNVADDEPAPPQDVVAHAARLLGLPAPPEEPFADADLSPMSRSFYAENKRVSNRALREELGLALRYPTYREGLAALL